MKSCILFLALIVFLLFPSCHDMVSKDKHEIENAIKAVLDEQVRDWNKGDIEKYMAGYYRSDWLRFASGGDVSYGWQPTLERYKKRYPDKAAMGTLTFSNMDMTVISEDAVLVFGRWMLQREKDEPWGLFTLLFRKTRDGWYIVHDHTSSASN